MQAALSHRPSPCQSTNKPSTPYKASLAKRGGPGLCEVILTLRRCAKCPISGCQLLP